MPPKRKSVGATDIPAKKAKPGKKQNKNEGATDKPAKKAKPDKKQNKNDVNGKDELQVVPDIEQQTTKAEAGTVSYDSDAKTADGQRWNWKCSSWNVNGIRAWLEKKSHSFITDEDPDVFCLQETKCDVPSIPASLKNFKGYHTYWLSGDKDGYSGTGMFTKTKPINVTYGIGIAEHDNEGRVITAEFEKLYVVTAYVPNAGRGLPRLDYRTKKWDVDFTNYLKKLDAIKPVVLCGDLNVSHLEIDLANPKSNTKSAGFTKEEREGFTNLLNEGFVDTFRHLYPTKTGAYTYWTYMSNARSKNVGWRLDYFVISQRLTSSLCDNIIRSHVMGSDHCPITLLLHI